MVYISKKKIDPKVESVLSDQLLSFIAAAQTKHEAATLATELLTETERIMLAKRLAIVVMLERGYSFRGEIERSLKVTPQTVARLWRRRKLDEFKKICKYARNYTGHFKRGDRFLQVLENWLTVSGAMKTKSKLINKRLD